MDRDRLGEKITNWLAANQDVEIIETKMLQSSDSSFHCLTCVVFYRPAAAGARAA